MRSQNILIVFIVIGLAEKLYPTLVELDSEVDTVQQASIEADKAILEIRDLRREEGIVCQR